jgi:2-hydroxychromene-2-carboxylate isomerase
MEHELNRVRAAVVRRYHRANDTPRRAMPTASKTIEFLFDFGSPTTYLAHTQLPRLAADTGAHIEYVPMLLGGVFKATGNQSPVMVPAKGRWMGGDLARFAQRYGVPFAFNPHFPINTLTLMRGAVGLQMRQPERFGAYVDAVFRAMWVEPVNLGDPALLASTLGAAGFDAVAFQALVGDAEVKARLIANTEAAVARGVFGAPTCFVGEQMFFGQDRLDFVREAVVAT